MNPLLLLIATALLTLNFSISVPSLVNKTNTSNIKSTALSSIPLVVRKKLAQLRAQAPNLNPKVLQLALTAYHNAHKRGEVKKPVLTVIDYSLPSHQERMWVFDLSRAKLLYNTHVAHGKNSGGNRALRFSNTHASKQSSLGTFVTKDTYIGHKGYSLNLKGLDKGFNDNALARRVVVHGAWYVEPSFIKRVGSAGLSWGCPAIAQTLAKPIINTIKNGSVIFAYFPEKRFLTHSAYLLG